MDGEKYQAIMVNPVTKKVTNIYSSRKKKQLYREFYKIPKGKREKVKFFICDMWDTYIELAQIFFRNATIVIDRFHYTRVVTNAFNAIRIQTQNDRSDEVRISFKHAKELLMKRTCMLVKNDKVDQFAQVDILLGCSFKLYKAYGLLQRFYEFNDSKTIDEARHKLLKFIYACYDSKLPEFEAAAKTLQHYSEFILNSFKTKYTNSYAEGKNTLMKTLKRIGFGYQNKDRFLKRVMHIENY
ncbi:MAG: transposase [Clostridia bacterium]|nr:transposase [Clostridia bacterium]